MELELWFEGFWIRQWPFQLKKKSNKGLPRSSHVWMGLGFFLPSIILALQPSLHAKMYYFKFYLSLYIIII